MIKVGILGITGYAGVETARLILNHPEFELVYAGSRSLAGKKLSDVYTNLRGITDIVCEKPDTEKIAKTADAVVTALPHGASMQFAGKLAEKGMKVVDLSADFRYDNLDTYEEVYDTKHTCPDINEKAVYGIPELYRDEIQKTKVVANPGCYPTCSTLGFAPLLKGGLVDPKTIIIDAASGVSGAGRKTKLPYQFCECTENFMAYKVAAHRHTGEIEEQYSKLYGENVKLSFTPHLVPMKRGMMTTIYANLNENTSASELISDYREFYKDEYFIRVLDEGVFPTTKSVAGSNFADIGIGIDSRVNRVIVVSVIDNIGKGASWQAIQNLNIICGLEEKTGLTQPGLYL